MTTAWSANIQDMSSESLWLAVKVISGSKTLFGSRIVQCRADESFGQLLSRLDEESFAEKTVELVKIGEGAQQHEVQLNAPLQLCSNFSCKTIEFRLALVAPAAEKPSKNAFDVLMSSSRRLLLPQKYNGERLRADQSLYNDVIDMFASWNIGWGPDSVRSIGERCVKTLASALWYLDPHHTQFKDRSCEICGAFAKFQGYNNYWKRKKEKKPQICFVDLDRHVQSLSSILSQPWCHRPHFKQLNTELSVLVEVMRKYCNYLQKHNQSMKEVHSSPSPMREVEENILVEIRSSLSVCDSQYSDIQQKLISLPLYTPVFLNDFSPSDRYLSIQ